MRPVLVLAGTTEARALAGLLAARGLPTIASLAGVTRDPAPYPVPVRVGGFGGRDGLVAWLHHQRPCAVIDATHPYAATMQANARAACAATATPRLRLLRPPWPVRPGWQLVPSLAQAAAALPGGARVLLTTGRQDLAAFAARPDCRCVLRTIEPVPDLPAHIEPVQARPPFALAEEIALMGTHRITHLVTKNAGGPGTAKLEAAEALGIATLVVARPVPPEGPTVATAEEAAAWLGRYGEVAP